MIRYVNLDYNSNIIRVGSIIDKLYNVLDIDGFVSFTNRLKYEQRYCSYSPGDIQKLRLNLWKFVPSIQEVKVNRCLTYKTV